MTRSDGGSAGGRVGGVDHGDVHAPARQPPRRGPSVVAVVALAGHHDDPPTVGAAQHAHGGPGDGRAGPFDQHLDGLGRGGIDGAHLVGGDDRDHRSARRYRHGRNVLVLMAHAPPTSDPPRPAPRVAHLSAPRPRRRTGVAALGARQRRRHRRPGGLAGVPGRPDPGVGRRHGRRRQRHQRQDHHHPLIATALATTGPVVTNTHGANLPNGVVSALLEPHPDGTSLVAEIDERWLPAVMEEVAVPRRRAAATSRATRSTAWPRSAATPCAGGPRRRGCTGVTVVANCDDPIVVHAVPDGADAVWVAAGMRWRWDAMSCPACGGRIDYADDGAWACRACEHRRPRRRRHDRRHTSCSSAPTPSPSTSTCPASTPGPTRPWRWPPPGSLGRGAGRRPPPPSRP